MPWTPVLQGSLARRGWERIEEIAHVLSKGSKSGQPTGFLSGGRAGAALFYAYLAKSTRDEESRRKAKECLDEAVDLCLSSPPIPGLMNGWTGVAWTVQHVEKLGVTIEHEKRELLLRQVDELLLDVTESESDSPRRQGVDLVWGLVGMGIYSLSRLPGSRARRICHQIHEGLERLAVRCPGGVGWSLPAEHMDDAMKMEFPEGCFHLGVAHGTPGVIGWLARSLQAGIRPEDGGKLISDAVPWLLRQRVPYEGRFEFPVLATAGKAVDLASVSWCVGNPGLACCVLAAAWTMGRTDWEREGKELAIQSAARLRRDREIVDTSLCHGAAGLGHLFGRLFQSLGESVFYETAVESFRASLYGLPQPEEDGRPRPESTSEPWRPDPEDPGFLVGASGIGLALLGGVSHVEPGWDEVLLTNLDTFPILGHSSVG